MKKLLCKKNIILFALTLLVVASCAFVCPAHAQQDEGYTIQSIANGNEFVGARMFGNYFAHQNLVNVEGIYMSMGVPVSVEIYTSEELPIDSRLDFSKPNATTAKLSEIFGQVDDIVNEIDELTNPMYNGQNGLPQSDVFKYNNATAGQTLEISQHTFTMLTLAQQCYEQTNGLFNPCTYRLVDLWGFSSRIFTYGLTGGTYGQPYDRQFTQGGGYALPCQEYIEAFSQKDFVSFASSSVQLSQSNGKYYVTKNVSPVVVDINGQQYSFDQWLDLGGVAKGYVADLVAQLLEQYGLEGYFVSIGDSSIRLGKSLNDKDHLIVQQDPFNPSYSALGYNFSNVGLACSGKYLRNYTLDGVVYNHLIDASTAHPSKGCVEGVMVVVKDNDYTATLSDCYATALSLMDEWQVVDYLNKYPNVLVSALCKNQQGKQLVISNLDKDQIHTAKTTFQDYAWAVTNSNGQLVIDENAVAPTNKNIGPIVAIVIACIMVIALAVVVVIFFLQRQPLSQRIYQARTQKLFKHGDVALYVALALVVVVMAVAVTPQQTAIKQVEVYDIQSNQLLFVYDISKDSIYINQQNGWFISTDRQDNSLTVTLSKQFDGQMRFNKVQIDISNNSSVKMIDSLCGRHQQCVKVFEQISRAGGTIVCSPNNLKVVTN